MSAQVSSDGVPFGGYLAGLLTGVVLSVLYVRFDWRPPAVVTLPGKVQDFAIAATADLDLSDPTRPVDVRRRALATVLATNPDLVIELDDETDGGLLAAWDARQARREARTLVLRDDAIDRALRHDALRRSLARSLDAAAADEPFVSVILDRTDETEGDRPLIERVRRIARAGE
ncbi:MAG: hypothetical protein AAGJ97_07925 [Planctomycetota bacterium]